MNIPLRRAIVALGVGWSPRNNDGRLRRLRGIGPRQRRRVGLSRMQGRPDPRRHRQGRERRCVVLRRRRSSRFRGRRRRDQRGRRHQGLRDRARGPRHQVRPSGRRPGGQGAGRRGRPDPDRRRRLRLGCRGGQGRPERRRPHALARRVLDRLRPGRWRPLLQQRHHDHRAGPGAGAVCHRPGLDHDLPGHRHRSGVLHRTGCRIPHRLRRGRG